MRQLRIQFSTISIKQVLVTFAKQTFISYISKIKQCQKCISCIYKIKHLLVSQYDHLVIFEFFVTNRHPPNCSDLKLTKWFFA